MTERTQAVLLALSCSLLTGAAHLIVKAAADRSRAAGWTDLTVLAAMALACGLMGAGFVLLLLALRRGALSTVYSLLAARYIWVVGVTPLLFITESWNPLKLAGAAVVAVGVALVARGEAR
jgi:drug/metabolite transporter (DMT)-like permease